jgi:hypothetical protein
MTSKAAFSFHDDALDAISGQQSSDRKTGNSASNDNDWYIHKFGNLSSAQEFSSGTRTTYSSYGQSSAWLLFGIQDIGLIRGKPRVD